MSAVPGASTAGVALVAAAAAAMRWQLAAGVSVGLVAAVVLAPVWLGALREYRWARFIVGMGIAAVAAGALLTALQSSRETSMPLLVAQSGELLALVGGAGMLLWARSILGSRHVVTAFGIGALANVLLTGTNDANAWKYSLAVPVALVVLGIAAHWPRVATAAILTGLAIVSLAADSRSMTAFLLLAAVAMLWQSWMPLRGGRARTWHTLVWLCAVLAASAATMQALVLDGVLGDAARQRSEAQIDAAGSLIAGGRPEMGASWALIGAAPLGYGSGTLPAPSDVRLAKAGMAALGYDPESGYVERYMFGGHFEVHSVVGDLWIRFGPLGAAVVVLLVAVAIVTAVRELGARSASAALILLAVLGTWDALFSPFLTSARTLALLFALAAPVVMAAARPRDRRSARRWWDSSMPR